MSSYTEGQIHQLANALEAKGFTPADITKLGQSEDLLAIRSMLRGTSEIKPLSHLVINCDADPFVPDGWSVLPDTDADLAKCQLPNRVKGAFVWDPKAVELYLSEHQKDDEYIICNNLRGEIAGKPVLSANVLDDLLQPKNQYLIPKEWKGKYILFWGTIYRNSDGCLCVRYLYWSFLGCWEWDDCGIYDRCYDDKPAALRAS